MGKAAQKKEGSPPRLTSLRIGTVRERFKFCLSLKSQYHYFVDIFIVVRLYCMFEFYIPINLLFMSSIYEFPYAYGFLGKLKKKVICHISFRSKLCGYFSKTMMNINSLHIVQVRVGIVTTVSAYSH